jgi:hypothetical protein
LTPDWDDPKFCALHKNYLSAYRAFLSALRKRREVRLRYWKNRARKVTRSPIGTPPKAAPKTKSARRPVTPAGNKSKNVMKVDMGDILGVQELIAKSPAPPTHDDPAALESYNEMFGDTQLKIYFNAKRKYAAALRALIEHQVKKLRTSARNRADFVANAQLLGADSDELMEREMAKMREEVRPIMEMAIGEYKANPGAATMSLLIETWVDGQLVGVEGSINDDFNHEVNEWNKLHP